MRAKSLAINCVVVKTIVHLNTFCFNINRFSTFYQDIGINVPCITGIICPACIQYEPNNLLLYFRKKQEYCHELPGEAIRTSKIKRGDMRNKEYMEAIKEQTQNG